MPFSYYCCYWYHYSCWLLMPPYFACLLCRAPLFRAMMPLMSPPPARWRHLIHADSISEERKRLSCCCCAIARVTQRADALMAQHARMRVDVTMPYGAACRHSAFAADAAMAAAIFDMLMMPCRHALILIRCRHCCRDAPAFGYALMLRWYSAITLFIYYDFRCYAAAISLRHYLMPFRRFSPDICARCLFTPLSAIYDWYLLCCHCRAALPLFIAAAISLISFAMLMMMPCCFSCRACHYLICHMLSLFRWYIDIAMLSLPLRLMSLIDAYFAMLLIRYASWLPPFSLRWWCLFRVTSFDTDDTDFLLITPPFRFHYWWCFTPFDFRRHFSFVRFDADFRCHSHWYFLSMLFIDFFSPLWYFCHYYADCWYYWLFACYCYATFSPLDYAITLIWYAFAYVYFW